MSVVPHAEFADKFFNRLPLPPLLRDPAEQYQEFLRAHRPILPALREGAVRAGQAELTRMPPVRAAGSYGEERQARMIVAAAAAPSLPAKMNLERSGGL